MIMWWALVPVESNSATRVPAVSSVIEPTQQSSDVRVSLKACWVQIAASDGFVVHAPEPVLTRRLMAITKSPTCVAIEAECGLVVDAAFETAWASDVTLRRAEHVDRILRRRSCRGRDNDLGRGSRWGRSTYPKMTCQLWPPVFSVLTSVAAVPLNGYAADIAGAVVVQQEEVDAPVRVGGADIDR